jgi:hypothetical protein
VRKSRLSLSNPGGNAGGLPSVLRRRVSVQFAQRRFSRTHFTPIDPVLVKILFAMPTIFIEDDPAFLNLRRSKLDLDFLELATVVIVDCISMTRTLRASDPVSMQAKLSLPASASGAMRLSLYVPAGKIPYDEISEGNDAWVKLSLP